MATKEIINEETIVRLLTSLWQVNRRMQLDAEPQFEAHGLDTRRFFLLTSVRKGTVYPKELSEKLRIPSTVLSRHIDQLVKQNFLERQIDQQDSRRTRLSLTQQGLDALTNSLEAIKADAGQRLHSMNPEDLDVTIRSLETFGKRDVTNVEAQQHSNKREE